jgi:hypothetical protein
MRFVYGTHHAATTITHHITSSAGANPDAVARAAR